MNKLIALLILVSVCAFGQHGTAKGTVTGVVVKPVSTVVLGPHYIEIPPAINNKFLARDSAVQVAVKEFQRFADLMKRDQETIIEMLFALNGIDNWKEQCDSVRYDKGQLLYKLKSVKPKQ